jgi:hypothetical protein
MEADNEITVLILAMVVANVLSISRQTTLNNTKAFGPVTLFRVAPKYNTGPVFTSIKAGQLFQNL